MLFNFAWKQFTFTSARGGERYANWMQMAHELRSPCGRVFTKLTLLLPLFKFQRLRLFLPCGTLPTFLLSNVTQKLISNYQYINSSCNTLRTPTKIHDNELSNKLRPSSSIFGEYPLGCPKFASLSHMAYDTVKFMAERKTKTKIRSAQLFGYWRVDCVAAGGGPTARRAPLNALSPNY